MIMQERYQEDSWKLLIGCIMLNQTKGTQAYPIAEKFFNRFPNPRSISMDVVNEIRDIIKPLGFYNRRTQSIIRFTKDWLYKDWKNVSECYGIGKYAEDSYEIFIKNNLKVKPKDKVLIKYLIETKKVK